MKPLGGGLYYTYANPLSGMAGPENFPFSYASGPQITALPVGPSLGAATLETMQGSPLAGAAAGLVYAFGGSNASAYPVAQLGAATDGIMAGLAGFKMPEAPAFGAANVVVNQADLDTLAATGVKFTPQNVLATGTTPSGQVVFLETGSSSAGLQHIIEGHGVDFANQGIAQSNIPSVVMAAVTQGKVVGTNGSAPAYEISYGGTPKYISVGVSSNGFIVRANPVSKWKPLK